MKEYSGILGDQQGLDHNKLKQNKYYQNHLKALELQKQQEIDDYKDLKIKIMAQAEQMQYDDDFDEEEVYQRDRKVSKYQVDVVKKNAGKGDKKKQQSAKQ